MLGIVTALAIGALPSCGAIPNWEDRSGHYRFVIASLQQPYSVRGIVPDSPDGPFTGRLSVKDYGCFLILYSSLSYETPRFDAKTMWLRLPNGSYRLLYRMFDGMDRGDIYRVTIVNRTARFDDRGSLYFQPNSILPVLHPSILNGAD